MIYTLEQGKQGWRLPRRYTIEEGSKARLAPSVIAGGLSLRDINLEAVAKYATVPIVSLVVLASLLQFTHDPKQAVQHHAPAKSNPVNSSSIIHIAATANTSTSNTAPSTSDTNSHASWSSYASNAAPSAESQTINTNPTIHDGSASSSPVTTPIATVPVSTDPPVPTVPTDPSAGNGSTDPTPPVSTDPTTGDGGVVVTTPVAQVGVDILPPSVNVGL